MPFSIRVRALVCLFALLSLPSLAPRVSAQDEPDCIPEGIPILPGQTILGDLVPEDCTHDPSGNVTYDAYVFSATAGTEYTVGMSYYPPAFLDPAVVGKGPDGAVVSSDDDSGIDDNARAHFTAPTSGLYRIEATSTGLGIGPYLVSLNAGACPPAAAPIGSGQSLAGWLVDADCFSPPRAGVYHDRYAFEAIAGTEYRIVMRTPADADNSDNDRLAFDAYLVLLGPDGAVVAENDDGGVGSSARVDFVAPASGTYTIEATSEIPVVGSYQIEMASGPCPRPATPIAAGQTLSGQFTQLDCVSETQPGFSDLFTFQAVVGQQVRITMSDDGTGDPIHYVDPYLVLRNASGAIVAEDDNGAGFQNAAILYTIPSSGAYTIEATSATEGLGGYALTVATVMCPAAPTPIAAGQTLAGSLSATDCFSAARPGSYSDSYVLTASAGLQYQVQTNPPSNNPFLTLAIVRSPSGATIGSGFGTIVFTAAAAGAYTIEVTTDSPGATGAYTIGVTAAACPPSATPVSEGQPASGTLSPSDCVGPNGVYDRFSFQAVPERMYRIRVVSSAFDPRVSLVGEYGYTVFCCEPTGTRTVTFRPATARTVLVDVGTFTQQGAYTVTLESYVCGSTNAEISVGQTIEGSIATTDCYSTYFIQIQPRYEDTYTFNATAGQAYVITLEAPGFFPYFRLTNPSGGVVVERGQTFVNSLTYTYTAPVSGVHSIEVSSAIERNTGTYTLSLASGAPCASDVTPIAAGQTLAGALEASDCFNASPRWATASTYDRFPIEMQAGVRYTIRMDSTEVETALVLRRADGSIVETAIDPSPHGSGFPDRFALMLYTAPESGTYFLDATSEYAEDYGGYTVSVASNASCAGTVTPIAFGQQIAGALESTDCDSQIQPGHYRDRYTFEGTAGTAVRISMAAFSVDPFLALLDANGNLLASDDDSGVGDDARIVFTLPATGTYTIEATSFQYNWTGEYTLDLRTSTGDECASPTAQTAPGANEFSSLDGTECFAVSRPGSFVDNWQFVAEANRPYTISLASNEFDAFVAVLDASGNVLATNDDGGGGLDARLVFTAAAPGSYTIEATSKVADAVGFYQLSIYAGLVGTTCVPGSNPISINQTLTGLLDYSDCYSPIQEGAFHDRYTFTTVAGKTYRVYMEATPVNGAPTLDPWLVLYFGYDGALVQGDDSDDGTNNAEIVFTAPDSASYTFEATTYGVEETGPYLVRVEELLPDADARRGDATCTPRTLKAVPGQKIENAILSTDCYAVERPASHVNRYTLDVLAGASYTITMKSAALDARLVVLGPSGQVVAEDDNGAGKLDARVVLAPQTAGVYTILALTTNADGTGRYDLTVDGRRPETVGIYVPATGAWFLRNANTPGAANVVFSFGAGGAGYVSLTGDWDGDGRATAGLYVPATGVFFLRNSNTPGGADATFTFGAGGLGLVPVVGDWDGNGTDTIGVYDPATGNFFLRNSNASGPADAVVGFGAGGAAVVPVVGDWNGDGRTTIGLYNATTGFFFLRNANTPGGADLVFGFGPAGAGLRAIVGDWDADGRQTVGLYDPATGVFFLRDEHAAGAADAVFGYGPAGATPLTGSWNGR
jgi:hypothetical protein